MPGCQTHLFLGESPMTNRGSASNAILGAIAGTICFWVAISPTFAQQRIPHDPAEPQQGLPHPKQLPRPTGAIARQAVDEKSMRALIDQLVSCGTRLSLSSWTHPNRGIGCGRAHIAPRLNEIAKDSAGNLQDIIDKFDSPPNRTP